MTVLATAFHGVVDMLRESHDEDRERKLHELLERLDYDPQSARRSA